MKIIDCYDDPNYTDVWMFLIETDSYSGNFQRELSGFATGVSNEHCSEDAKDYCKTFGLDFDECLESWGLEYENMSNEYGEDISSMFIFGDPSECNGLAIYFNKKPEQWQLDRMKQRTLEFAKMEGFKVLKFRLVQRTVEVNEIELSC